MIIRAFLICSISVLIASCHSKKEPLAQKRTPVGNEYFLTHNSQDSTTVNIQDTKDLRKEYFDFNTHNEQVKYYQAPEPKKVFSDKKNKNTFNMQQHIKEQKDKKSKKNTNQDKTNSTIDTAKLQNSSPKTPTLDKKPNTSGEKQVIAKPKKKIGLVKVITKEKQVSSPYSENSTTKNPMDPITLSKKNENFIPVKDVMQYVENAEKDGKKLIAKKETNTKNKIVYRQNNHNSTTIPAPTAPPAPSAPPIQSIPPLNVPTQKNQVTTSTNSNESGTESENKPIPLPFD